VRGLPIAARILEKIGRPRPRFASWPLERVRGCPGTVGIRRGEVAFGRRVLGTERPGVQVPAPPIRGLAIPGVNGDGALGRDETRHWPMPAGERILERTRSPVSIRSDGRGKKSSQGFRRCRRGGPSRGTSSRIRSGHRTRPGRATPRRRGLGPLKVKSREGGRVAPCSCPKWSAAGESTVTSSGSRARRAEKALFADEGVVRDERQVCAGRAARRRADG